MAASDAPSESLPRRRFFRSMAGELAETTATLAAAAGTIRSELQRPVNELAAAAGIGFGDVVVVDRPAPDDPAVRGAAPTFRSPYRLVDNALIVLDQRRVPGAAVEVPCLSAADAAAAIRDELAQGPGTIAAVAAYGLAAGAAARLAVAAPPSDVPTPSDAPPASGVPAPLAAIYRDANLLFATAPWVALLRRALDRQVARAEAVCRAAEPYQVGVDDAVEPGPAGVSIEAALAGAMRAEADAIVMDELSELSRVVAAGVNVLRDAGGSRRTYASGPAAEPLRVLVHGPVGSLAFGQLGTAVNALVGAAAADVPLRVWATEGRPRRSGARSVWELDQAGIHAELVPDSAAGGLLASSLDVVLLGALGVTEDGAVVDEPGAYALAVLAARHGVPVYVFILRSMLFAPPTGHAPQFDVTPPELVTGLVTERALLLPPFGPGLAELVAGTHTERSWESSK